ncbi:MAG: Coq4 family protein [Pseudomonadota bacterium]
MADDQPIPDQSSPGQSSPHRPKAADPNASTCCGASAPDREASVEDETASFGKTAAYSIEDAVWINGFACPPAPTLRRLHAAASVMRLVRNKEDTRQVFETVDALAGKAGHRQFKRFTDTPYGRRVAAEPVRAEDILSNREWLRSLPPGSFGRAYLEFMEGEDLTPEGLLSSALEAGIDFRAETDFPAYQRIFLHQAVMHDVLHVLSGYGRDALGEFCNLAFTLGQSYNRGFDLIIAIGLMAQKLEAPRAPLIAAVRQGRRMGRQSDFVFGFDLEELLPKPLSVVRRELNILEPTIYNAVPQDLKDRLLKPRRDLTQTEQEAAAGAHA